MANDNQSTILITGGAGYIGSWVTRRLLASGNQVVVLDNMMYSGKSLLGVLGHPNLRIIKGDVRQQADVDSAMDGVDHVVHLAAIVGEAACDKDPDVTRAINFGGTQNVARSARSHDVQRMVFFSTCSSYGVQDTSVLADEETELNPVSLYAETKIDSEKFLLDTSDGNMLHTIFRPATVHGSSARMRFDLIVNHFVRDAYATGKLTIFAPDMWRPLVWVGDPAQAIELALNAEENLVRDEVFNLGGVDGNYTKGEIGEIIKRRVVPNLELEFSNNDPDLRSYRVDFNKIHDRLGFTSSKTLEQAIAEIHQTLETGMVEDPFAQEYRND
jgi:nucleoside-diphosphate-sugar epimerase